MGRCGKDLGGGGARRQGHGMLCFDLGGTEANVAGLCIQVCSQSVFLYVFQAVLFWRGGVRSCSGRPLITERSHGKTTRRRETRSRVFSSPSAGGGKTVVVMILIQKGLAGFTQFLHNQCKRLARQSSRVCRT